MKKNGIVLLLSAISILSLTYGYYQNLQAEKYQAADTECEIYAKEMQIRYEKEVKDQAIMAGFYSHEASKLRLTVNEKASKK